MCIIQLQKVRPQKSNCLLKYIKSLKELGMQECKSQEGHKPLLLVSGTLSTLYCFPDESQCIYFHLMFYINVLLLGQGHGTVYLTHCSFILIFIEQPCTRLCLGCKEIIVSQSNRKHSYGAYIFLRGGGLDHKQNITFYQTVVSVKHNIERLLHYITYGDNISS